MLLRRPLSPTNATPHDAIAYLASACDGAHKLDGHGFSSDHVAIGHRLARTYRWSRRGRRQARNLIVYYRQQLTQAGFNIDAILTGTRPTRIRRRLLAESSPRWARDPTRVHTWRYWNGRRWTHAVNDGAAPPFCN